jgi:hypothetical protein
MQSPCGPPEFDTQDWSEFDFSRWHLDGVTLESAAAALAGIAEGLFTSDEWQENFKAALPDLQTQALAAFKEHSSQLQEQRSAIVQDFDKRTAAAQQLNDEFRKSAETASAPPVVKASPDSFQLGVKVVTEKDARLGLPGLTVQMIDPKNEKAALAEVLTDHNGNAVLTVPPELAKERDKRDTTLQILDPSGKPLTRLADAVCIRVGQTETKVVAVGESPAIAENQKVALQIRSQIEARAGQLAGRADVLKQERQSRLDDLDCRLRDNEAIIAEIEQTEARPTDSESAQQPAEAVQDQADSSQPEPSKRGAPPTREKRRKKS